MLNASDARSSVFLSTIQNIPVHGLPLIIPSIPQGPLVFHSFFYFYSLGDPRSFSETI